ncbi:uncharacterized protein PFL1_01744 [Pseudozyma flocculosa PF-1]|uniref:uncharacterized protein n=1 Tax=Pseudozyma flocculosa PF-1 TaxID=1277687 RepID=UPI0004560C47|nr:uncharacterized protein PFL1_01744 [Pseudozyma flocculosa PF-1]EPQ30846.1 hypothetical protein PFL1_01744 [Pseudozyma flocculosa PF-1]
MAIKPKRPQIGKIKQWSSGLGAKLSAAAGGAPIDPTLKQDLYGEIELRGIANSNLYAATEHYWSSLAKKKPIPFDPTSLPAAAEDSASISSGALAQKHDSKLLPIESIGIAMSSYGAQFPDSSAYGTALSSLGEAHVQLGSLQAAFAKDTSNIFLARIARSKTAIESFHAAMKKLEAATTKLDAAQAKVQKSKKEKRDLEEELRLAKAAYDEAVSDVEARAEAIQQSEHDDLDCLETYIQTHIDYLAQAQAVLDRARTSASTSGSSFASVGGSASRRPPPAPLSRPQSAGGSRPAPPALPRRTSAREPMELNLKRTSSRVTTGSTVSLTPSEIRRVREGLGNDSRDPAATPGNDDDNDGDDGDGQSTAKRGDKEKKAGRLRMPSFSAASGTVSSMASGIGGTFSRSKSSTLFGGASGSSQSHSPDKEMGEGGPSKWSSFMTRGRKESGFQDLDRDDARRASLRREADQVHNKVGSEDVDLGLGEADVGDVLSSRRSSTLRPSFPRRDSRRDSLGADDDESPFSPASHGRGPHVTPHLDVNHTGLSAYSDGGDPFSGGGAGMLSPQGTGLSTGQFHHHTDDDADDHDDEAALTGGGRRRGDTVGSNSGGGWTRSLPFANGNREYRNFAGDADEAGRRATGNGSSSFPMASSSASSSGTGVSTGAGSSSRPPPPPVPSSSAFLSKVKGKPKPPPVPPPLPTRSLSGLP